MNLKVYKKIRIIVIINKLTEDVSANLTDAAKGFYLIKKKRINYKTGIHSYKWFILDCKTLEMVITIVKYV